MIFSTRWEGAGLSIRDTRPTWTVQDLGWYRLKCTDGEVNLRRDPALLSSCFPRAQGISERCHQVGDDPIPYTSVPCIDHTP